MRLTEIKIRRTDQIADIFDEQNAAFRQRQLLQRMTDAVRVQMAPFAGIDLHRRRSGSANPLGIVGGLLIAADDRDRKFSAERLHGLTQQGGFARSGAGHQIQREHPASSEQLPVFPSKSGVLCQNVLFNGD